jgi:SAM-dependent methyltransferase
MLVSEQQFTFDEVAELYDRTRPRYPEALVDELVALSGISEGGRILEIGCGTGQLTAALASRGFRMVCLEPGPRLARIAQKRLAAFPTIEVVSQTFEAWTLDPAAFSLVVSAQAFHWLAPEARFAKSAQALCARGALAVVGNAVVFQDSPARKALDAAYATYAPGMSPESTTRWYAEDGPVPTLFAESALFDPVTWRRYPWSRVYTAAEYLDLLRTHSNHRLLAEPQREFLLAAIGRVIRLQGGNLEVRYEAHLYLARRIPSA